MLIRCICSAALVAFALVFASPDGARAAADDGIVKFKSAYDMPETIKRMKKDIADKGIMFFDEIDQAKLAADAGVLDASRVRQSAARHAVPDLRSRRWARLAGAGPRLSGRQG